MFVVVPAQHAYVLERLGRYRTTLSAGFHFVVPVIDRVAFRFSLRPRDTNLETVAITLDDVPVKVTGRARWSIVNAERAAYAVADLERYVAGVVQSAQRQWIAGKKETYIRENTRELEAEAANAAETAMETAGVKLEDVSVSGIARESD
jgi:regulator of protease activity HflC (stomatin/prohibitin superfamily)